MNVKTKWEAYFELLPFKSFFFGQGHLSAWRVCNAGDHTHAHADLLIIYANFPP